LTRHLAIVGPTAAGKSAVALAVARTLGDVEIVSLDSMQVYRGMDIGTAKPSRAERATVAHHIIDVVDPSEEWTVRDTQVAAQAALAEIEGRGRRALLVGGTGLYVRAVVDGLSVPPRDLEVRAALERETASDEGRAEAYDRLVSLDPLAASRIEPGNTRRIVRALEVMQTTGRTFSSFGAGLAEYGPPAFDVGLVGIWLPRAELGRRIGARFTAMRAAGLEAEVRALADHPDESRRDESFDDSPERPVDGSRRDESFDDSPERPVDGSRRDESFDDSLTRSAGRWSRSAAQAIGYKEILAHLDGEIPSIDDAFDLAVRRTRQFARRQRVWFRRDPRIRWVGTARNPQDLAAVVLALWGTGVATVAAERT
jgi:tRNA dimethylallyltransferase